MSFIRGFHAGRRPIPQYDLEPRGSGRITDNTIYIGFVKNNNDPQRMGRLEVWIPEIGGDPADPQNWFTVSYASPFAGATDPHAIVADSKTEDGAQKSYGFWAVPPDLNNEVLVCFVNGDTARGFWFACIWQQNMNHMVPGLAVDTTTEPPANQRRDGNLPPVVEYNKDSNVNPDAPARAVFTPLTNGLSKQGLFSDTERGPSSTSARRESPSHVLGLLSPRGNTIHIDDNPSSEFIRMRTRSGAQIVISETTGFVYINSKDGNSWVEISDVGVDVYSRGAVSLRAQGSLNLRADGNMNLESGGSMNLLAGGNLTLQAAGSIQGKTNGALVFESGAGSSIKSSGDLLLDSGGNLRLSSASDMTMASGGNNIRSSKAIYDNSSPSAPAANAPAAAVPSAGALTDVTPTAPFTKQTVNTILSRMPTHEPYVGHPSNGVALPETATQEEIANATPVASTALTGSGQPANQQPAPDNSPTAKTSCGGHKISKAVLAAIREASSKTGVDFGYLMAMAAQESGFNPNAKASTSSASGLYQLINSTWSTEWGKYGAANQIDPNNHFDPRGNALLGAYFAKENQSGLQSAGLPVTPGNLYLCHFLGLGGARQILRANASNPSSSSSAAAPSAAAANRSVFSKNPTVGQLVQWAANVMASAACYEKYKTSDPPFLT